MRKKIFLAAPYASDPNGNTGRALIVTNDLIDAGFSPFTPHFFHFIDKANPKDRAIWVDVDNSFLVICDGLLRLDGESEGADSEVKLAEENNIPVFHSIEQLKYFFKGK